jgi:hypothetical protein
MVDVYWSAIDVDQNKKISFEEFMVFESYRHKDLFSIEDYVDCIIFF